MYALSVATGKGTRTGGVASENPIEECQLRDMCGEVRVVPDPKPAEVVDLGLQMRDPDGAARLSR